ncbi:septum formation initiator family protein [Brachybacterium tyrofermentans]|uniref:septum formation initiator family protein n=1 Tax=Brachybacterium tyrofermentans TaxID=47848 RepID=UPI003FCF40DE
MASTSAVHAPAVRPVRGPRSTSAARPRLAIVAAPKTAGSSMPFTILCTLIVTATLAALLYMNIQMSDTSYEITRLQSQSQRLTEEKQALTETDERLGTPQELERQARELGMVPVTDPAYIDLDTGKIIGETSSAAQTEVNPELAKVAPEAAVPPAEIYDKPTTYHGMGNEGV